MGGTYRPLGFTVGLETKEPAFPMEIPICHHLDPFSEAFQFLPSPSLGKGELGSH